MKPVGNQLTVSQLIDLLSEVNGDLPVFSYDGESGHIIPLCAKDIVIWEKHPDHTTKFLSIT